MGTTWGEQSLTIAAPPDRCYAEIIEFESYPEWQAAVDRAEVLDRDEQGRGRTVRFEIDIKVGRFSYTLRYHHEPPGRLWWEFVEARGLRSIEGEFSFEPDPAGSGTIATYRLGVDPGVPVPGLIAGRLTGEVMKRVVTDLRDRLEQA